MKQAVGKSAGPGGRKLALICVLLVTGVAEPGAAEFTDVAPASGVAV